jgi:hypothetical protein
MYAAALATNYRVAFSFLISLISSGTAFSHSATTP